MNRTEFKKLLQAFDITIQKARSNSVELESQILGLESDDPEVLGNVMYDFPELNYDSYNLTFAKAVYLLNNKTIDELTSVDLYNIIYLYDKTILIQYFLPGIWPELYVPEYNESLFKETIK